MKGASSGMLSGEKIRVLVADDSVLARRMIARILERDPDILLVGTARDGADALKKVHELQPDIVTLDVEMPELDGLQALRQIATEHPAVRVIMLSCLTRQGVQVSMEALMLGASDYITKPDGIGEGDFETLAAEVLFKVKQFYPQFAKTLPPARATTPTPVAMRTAAPPLRTCRSDVEICAIGISTGGPPALMEALPMVPKDFPVPIVIVQHMPANFTKLLAERLSLACAISVVEGTEGMMLRPGLAVIAPGGFHMRVARDGHELVVRLDQGEKENSCRPAVDVLFRSIAEVLNGKAIAAVLTGMGQDGLIGAQLLKARGAAILAQDQATSVVWGMPGALVAAGVADAVLPLRQIVPEILQRIQYR